MKNWKLIIIFAFVIILTFSSIVVSGFWKDKTTINSVQLFGNITLSKDEIFQFAKLTDSAICSGNLTIEMIESRISKHPNIKSADVFKEGTVIKIEITEKNPFAVVSNGNEFFMIDDKLTLYKIKKEHTNIDLPVISGLSDKISENTFGKNDLDLLKIAQFIISKSVQINKILYNYISEINFSNPNGIILITSDDATPIYFIDYYVASKKQNNLNKSNIVDINNTYLKSEIEQKLIQLNCFLKQVRVYKASNSIEYVDMRYNDLIFVKNKK